MGYKITNNFTKPNSPMSTYFESDINQFDLLEVIHESEHSTIRKVKIRDEHKKESQPKFYALKSMKGKSKEQQRNELINLKRLENCPEALKLYSAFIGEQGQLCL